MTQNQKIIQMFKNGESKKEICRQLDLNYGFVRGEIRRARVEVKKTLNVPQEKIDKIKALIQFNIGSPSLDYGPNEIAPELDLKVCEVREVIKMIRYESRTSKESNQRRI